MGQDQEPALQPSGRTRGFLQPPEGVASNRYVIASAHACIARCAMSGWPWKQFNWGVFWAVLAALNSVLAAGIVGVAFALGLFSLARKVFPSPPTLVVSEAFEDRLFEFAGGLENGLTITASSPRGYGPGVIRFCIKAPKYSQFVGNPLLTIPRVAARGKIKGQVVMVDPFGVTYDREKPNEDCYTLVGLRGGQGKLSIRYRTIYSPPPSVTYSSSMDLPVIPGLRLVPVGNVRVVWVPLF